MSYYLDINFSGLDNFLSAIPAAINIARMPARMIHSLHFWQKQAQTTIFEHFKILFKVAPHNEHKMIKWDASSRWSFGSNSAWGSKETMTIRKTNPTLEKTSFEKRARTLAQRLDQNRTIFGNAHADLTPTYYLN